jgi:hypothetical protein
VGVNIGYEFVFYLLGNDAYKLFAYSKRGRNVGDGESMGLYAFTAIYHHDLKGLNAQSLDRSF